MPFQPSQPFHEYLLVPWDKIEQLFTDWSRIGERLGNTELHSRSLWGFAAHIHTALQAARQDPKNYILDPLEKSVLRFVDADIAQRFLDGMAEMETALRQNTGEPAGAALPPAFEALDARPDISAPS